LICGTQCKDQSEWLAQPGGVKNSPPAETERRLPGERKKEEGGLEGKKKNTVSKNEYLTSHPDTGFEARMTAVKEF